MKFLSVLDRRLSDEHNVDACSMPILDKLRKRYYSIKVTWLNNNKSLKTTFYTLIMLKTCRVVLTGYKLVVISVNEIVKDFAQNK